MKILMAYYRYSPHINGPSTYIDLLRSELIKAGNQVDILSHDDNGLYIQIGEKHKVNKALIKSMLFHRYQTFYTPYSPWVFWREIERYSLEWAAHLMNINEYDLIHSHDFMMARALSRVKPTHIPLIVSLHNCKFHEAAITNKSNHNNLQIQQYTRYEEYLGAMSGDVTVVPSVWLKQQLIAIGVAPEKINVIPYGIQPNVYIHKHETPALSTKNNTFSKKIILCPARLVPIKGQRYLIEALHQLQKERKDFICLFAGEGSDREELQQLTESLNLQPYISFLGKRTDIPLLMRTSDVIVLPSLHDTFPFVLLEGQYSAKPILATSVGGISEIITDGFDGLLVPPGNSLELVRKLRLLLDDPALRQRLGLQAQQTALEQWQLDKHMESIYALYERIKLPSDKVRHYPSLKHWQLDIELLNQIDTGITIEEGITLQGHIPPEFIDSLEEYKKPYIHLYDLSGVVLQTATIDSEGRYVFQLLPRGDFILKSPLLRNGITHISI
ncbi:glycosyltransferase family 4 protein [Paenibacillus psychroresistens]|uniref:glycosyltransferase family 4 protein n=1 Tax=Paenibacillus psychroresistens TaxID=1778678 RepID=UPI001391BA1F|nr:glycosyltransferase family 4 protein [Paenibacillus psychroresistens]